MDPELHDSITLLELIISECPKRCETEHSWRKCKRCLALDQIDFGMPYPIKLIRRAIEELKRK